MFVRFRSDMKGYYNWEVIEEMNANKQKEGLESRIKKKDYNH